MRLWHQDLISKLPRQQLLGQHRECAALRGNGWGRPHATVNYVFAHPRYKLFQYHLEIMREMERRGYRPDEKWKAPEFAGKNSEPIFFEEVPLSKPIYPEHDSKYLEECLENLAGKGIFVYEIVKKS